MTGENHICFETNWISLAKAILFVNCTKQKVPLPALFPPKSLPKPALCQALACVVVSVHSLWMGDCLNIFIAIVWPLLSSLSFGHSQSHICGHLCLKSDLSQCLCQWWWTSVMGTFVQNGCPNSARTWKFVKSWSKLHSQSGKSCLCAFFLAWTAIFNDANKCSTFVSFSKFSTWLLSVIGMFHISDCNKDKILGFAAHLENGQTNCLVVCLEWIFMQLVGCAFTLIWFCHSNCSSSVSQCKALIQKWVLFCVLTALEIDALHHCPFHMVQTWEQCNETNWPDDAQTMMLKVTMDGSQAVLCTFPPPNCFTSLVLATYQTLSP